MALRIMQRYSECGLVLVFCCFALFYFFFLVQPANLEFLWPFAATNPFLPILQERISCKGRRPSSAGVFQKFCKDTWGSRVLQYMLYASGIFSLTAFHNHLGRNLSIIQKPGSYSRDSDIIARGGGD